MVVYQSSNSWVALFKYLILFSNGVHCELDRDIFLCETSPVPYIDLTKYILMTWPFNPLIATFSKGIKSIFYDIPQH